MNRRHILKSIPLAGLAGFAQASAQEVPPGPSGPTSPTLTNPARDSITVLWGVGEPSHGWVEYGDSPQLGLRADGGMGGLRAYDAHVIKVRVGGLSPGHKVFYRCVTVPVAFQNAYSIQSGAPVFSKIHSFTVPDPAAAKVRFHIWNDTHEVKETLRTLSGFSVEEAPDFLLWNGDMCNSIDREEEMAAQFVAPDMQAPFAAVPMRFVRGNHDVRGAAARHLSRYCDTPDGEWFSTFRHGPLAGIILDTGEDKPDDHPVYGGLNSFKAFRAAQAVWLAKALQAPEIRSAPFKILFCHIPLRWIDESQSGHWCGDGRDQWHDSLVAHGVKLVISGHTHQHALLPSDARHPYAQLVGGGPQPQGATIIRGEADAKRMSLVMSDLKGTELNKIELEHDS